MIWMLAHQGGWDEALLFVGPLVLAFIAIKAVERRARNDQESNGEPTEHDPEASGRQDP